MEADNEHYAFTFILCIFTNLIGILIGSLIEDSVWRKRLVDDPAGVAVIASAESLRAEARRLEGK
jgi:hypothetical protein